MGNNPQGRFRSWADASHAATTNMNENRQGRGQVPKITKPLKIMAPAKVNINSFKLQKDEKNTTFSLSFSFDTKLDIAVSLYLAENPDLLPSSKPAHSITLSKENHSAVFHDIDFLSLCTTNEMFTRSFETNFYPLIVIIQNLSDSNHSEEVQYAEAQTLFFSFVEPEDDASKILLKQIKQSVTFNGKQYVYKKWFGDEEKIENRNREEGDDLENKNCVICLENSKDVVLNPCLHKCLCSSCSIQLQKQANPQCPLCRRLVFEFWVVGKTSQIQTG
eukprot:maker-scaffold_5-snap-gene-7.3-mRNA-1 protein AED:0.00 eAED:0.00 QI:87/1/1/1/1/1/2/44/275